MPKTIELTEQQKTFLEALGGEAKGNVRMAMDLAGYSKNYKVQELVKVLQEEIIEVAQNLLASNSVNAVFGLLNVLNEPNTVGAKNAIAAANSLLDRAGLVKKEQIEVKTDMGGLFILPPKRTDD